MEEIICFLTEYTGALEAMERKQMEKLRLLVTRELDKVEQTIMIQQAIDKKLGSLEQKWQELFAAHGLDGKTLKEIAEPVDGARQEELLELYRRVDSAIGNIRYYNGKAEMIAKSELEHMDIDSRVMGGPAGIYGYPSIQKGSKPEKET